MLVLEAVLRVCVFSRQLPVLLTHAAELPQARPVGVVVYKMIHWV